MAPMSCPACGEAVEEGAVICPHCEAVLDTSAFDAGGGEEEEAPPPKAKAAPEARSGSGPRKAAGAPAGPAVPEIQQTWGRGAKRRKKAEVDYSADRVLGDTLESIRAMMPFDQLTFWGLIAMGVTLFLPWKVTQAQGVDIGAFGGGLPVVVLAVLAAVALFMRTSDGQRGVPAHYLAMGQVAAAVLSVGYCTWFFFDAIDNHTVHTAMGTAGLMPASSPQLGVVLCAFATIVMGAGSVWALTVELESAG